MTTHLGSVHIADPDTGLVWEFHVTESPVPPATSTARRDRHMNTSDILNRAADLIEQRGWAKGAFAMSAEPGTTVCLEGALSAVLELQHQFSVVIGGEALAYPPVDCPAYAAVATYLELNGGDRLFDWNDDQSDATAVIEVLRACAVIESARERETAAVS